VAAGLVVLASGEGTLLQALLDAGVDPDFGATVVAVGSDRPGIRALERAERAGVPTYVLPVDDYPDRAAWDRAFTEATAAYAPDLVVSAGFMKLLGPAFLHRFGGRVINSHPTLLPSFPGMHGVRDALAYGVKVTGCSLIVVDASVDDGPILAQAAVPVLDDDDEQALHERVKSVERALLVETVGRMVREGWSVDGRKARLGTVSDGRGA
jgi:phosphoribosylglycinamide formyltransferase 1